MTDERKTEQITFMLTADLRRDLGKFAKEDQRTIGDLLRIILSSYARTRKAKKVA